MLILPTAEQIKQAFLRNLTYLQGRDLAFASSNDLYLALAYTIREQLIERWLKTTQAYDQIDAKMVFYLSAEYLLGDQLDNNLFNCGLEEAVVQALSELNLSLDELRVLDTEPGLGNGGLGRLAACFLDSMATMGIPATGYGIRYEYGIFKQTFKDGWQTEQPDDWLRRGDPWEFSYPDHAVEVGFGGSTEGYFNDEGVWCMRWNPSNHVMGVPYNLMVPGYRSDTVNTLRLWSASATQSFDLQVFNSGDYVRAVEQKTLSENISMVLYPDDTTPQGKTLRLQQQYFFVACSLADIIRNYRERYEGSWDQFPEKVAIQLNDTHPSIAIAELMRLLVDVHHLGWDRAWTITHRTFAYTVHTLMPEALEEWPVTVFQNLLPRHLEIIYEINRRFLDDVRTIFPNDLNRLIRMSIIRETPEKRVRMAYLAAVGSHSVNGVAELQTNLLKERTFRDFFEMYPKLINNKTNGVTPRRFLGLANPRLASLITSKIGSSWLTNLDELIKLEDFANDEVFCENWRKVKFQNKQALSAYILSHTGVAVDPNSVFDVMVKRLHEYKRQLLKVLHIITLYLRVKDSPHRHLSPRTYIFGAKSAPGYSMAKLIIKLINSVAEIINNDPDVRGRLKVVFLPNYNVVTAERIFPAANISEQISLAGKEASGTGNMKLALNGAITVGTLDGANIEIRQLVGSQNFFLFGLTTDEVNTIKSSGYHPREYYDHNPELHRAIDAIASGIFSPSYPGLFAPIVQSLLDQDEFMLLADYQSYVDCAESAVRAYQDQDTWTRMSIFNTARCGFFSSDRSIRQYCEEIWEAAPINIDEIDPPEQG